MNQDRIPNLTDEVRQLKEQYVDEVGTGRRIWPRSIKGLVFELGELGVPLKKIAQSTTVPYQTILSWRYQARKSPKFHELTVKARSMAKIGSDSSVTIESAPISEAPRGALVIVSFADGLRIESADPKSIVEIIRSLKAGAR